MQTAPKDILIVAEIRKIFEEITRNTDQLVQETTDLQKRVAERDRRRFDASVNQFGTEFIWNVASGLSAPILSAFGIVDSAVTSSSTTESLPEMSQLPKGVITMSCLELERFVFPDWDRIEGQMDTRCTLLDFWGKFMNCIKMVQAAVGAYRGAKDALDKRNAAQSALERVRENVQLLALYRKRIDSFVIVLIRILGRHVFDVQGALEQKRPVPLESLELTHWKVKSDLKDFKLLMSQITEGFQVHDAMVRSVEKLMDAMKALFKVHAASQRENRQ